MAQNGLLIADQPYKKGVAITPSDTTDFDRPTDAIYVGGAGNIVVVGDDGVAYTLTDVVAGAIYPVRARRVNASNTTATNLVALRWE